MKRKAKKVESTKSVKLKNRWDQWKGTLIVLVMMFTIRSAIADWNHVPTGSMKPTIMEGDRIVVNKLAYDLKVPFTTATLMTWGNPERGDIVVYYSPVDGKRYIKRVIGLPGNSVEMINNQLILNGERAYKQRWNDCRP